MEKEARRKIISEKSQYVRKPNEWNLRDEIQFRLLMRKVKKYYDFHYYGVRPRVKEMLEKYGNKVSHWSGDCYRISRLT